MQAWPRPEPRPKAELKAAQHWNWTQRPFYGSPAPLRCPACARLFVFSLEPRPATIVEDTDYGCFKACYACNSVHISDPAGLSSLSGQTPNATPQQRSTSKDQWTFLG